MMDKAELIARLRKDAALLGDDEGRLHGIKRLEAALSVPASFDELEWELAPAARYVGPGVWIDAIENALKYDSP
ncbi:MAG: hypothetical protein LBP93_06770 [Treponema sp.]|jgi:hypothetical protein|nr:hypothetical protein [Treponema sp.]